MESAVVAAAKWVKSRTLTARQGLSDLVTLTEIEMLMRAASNQSEHSRVTKSHIRYVV